MNRFDYDIAESLDAAIQAQDGGSVYKAGGMDLLDLMKEGVLQPGRVVSLHRVPDLAVIEVREDGLRIGALATLADLGRNEALRARYGALHTAAAHAATPQVRERATLGGNLCQRPRCWYYRNIEFNCLKKGGGTCYAYDGENQYHAIFGVGPCYIVHPSNCAPALVAMDAVFHLQGKNGAREVPARDFFVSPRERLDAENVLAPDEALTHVHVPVRPEQSATIELREKQSFDWPLVIASVARVQGRWRVCLGAVAPVPWVAEAAEALLEDKEITPELAAEAGEAAADGANPMSGNAYKVKLVKTAVKRALLRASGEEARA